MQYISPIPIEHPFTLTSDILWKQHVPNAHNFLNAECYFKNVIIAKDHQDNFYTDVDIHTTKPFTNNKTTFKENTFVCSAIFNLDNYYNNLPDYNQHFPTCIELEDIVIDSFTGRWFEITSIVLSKEIPDSKYTITYNLQSSDNKQIRLSEEKLSFYLNSNIFIYKPFKKKSFDWEKYIIKINESNSIPDGSFKTNQDILSGKGLKHI